VTSKPDLKVMVLLLVFMQLTRDLFAIAKFLFYQSDSPTDTESLTESPATDADDCYRLTRLLTYATTGGVSKYLTCDQKLARSQFSYTTRADF